MAQLSQTRWLLNAVLFAGFIACFFLELTGVNLHQWLGLAAGAIAIYHLVIHQNWVMAVTRRLFGKTSDQAQAYYLIDAILLAGFLTMIGTGLVISTWLGLTLANYAIWRVIHITASILTLLVVVLKIWLHDRWIISTGRKLFAVQVVNPRVQPEAAQAADRRAFLKLMGVVGAASLFAFSSSMQSLWSSDGAADQQANGASTTGVASSSALITGSSWPSNASASTSSSSGSCTIQCNRRCSYPGRCGRYVDSNSNGRCDRGECLS